ncbi:MAG: Mitochondrial inner membrane organizing system component [Trizodia sp. TS-e1964]|nr:MAG: Mitochondrial inner membrane organizing system component [Trizodia sp. TS-e1964]
MATPGDTTPPAPAPSKPLSEALLNEKWDHCLSSLAVRTSLGLGFGVVFSVLLFKRRAWPALLGGGFGAGRAWEECDNAFRRAGAPAGLREPRKNVRP